MSITTSASGSFWAEGSCTCFAADPRRYRSRVAAAERLITTPEPQTAVPVDEPFTVAGDGCPPESSVTVTVGSGRFEATANADDAGAFSTSLTLPSTYFDFDAEIFDVNEFVITGTCGDVRLTSGVLVPRRPSQVAQIPSGGVHTGEGGTARMSQPYLGAGLFALLRVAGALTTLARRRRIKRT